MTLEAETASEPKTSVEDCDTLSLNSDNRSSSFSGCENEEASNNAETREDKEDKKCDADDHARESEDSYSIQLFVLEDLLLPITKVLCKDTHMVGRRHNSHFRHWV